MLSGNVSQVVHYYYGRCDDNVRQRTLRDSMDSMDNAMGYRDVDSIFFSILCEHPKPRYIFITGHWKGL